MLDKTNVQHTRSKQNCLRQPFSHPFNISRVLPRTTTLNKRTRTRNFSQNCCVNMGQSKLYTLSEEVLVLILEYLDARTLIRLSKTCRLFHRLCHSDVIWRHRCKVGYICSYRPALTIFCIHSLSCWIFVTLTCFLWEFWPKTAKYCDELIILSPNTRSCDSAVVGFSLSL